MQVDCKCWFCVCRVVTDQFWVVCLFFLVNKQFLQVLMIYLTLKCTLAHSTSSNQGLSLILLGVLFFFSRSRAGLTNRVPVRDSRAGAPLRWMPKSGRRCYGLKINFGSIYRKKNLSCSWPTHPPYPGSGFESRCPLGTQIPLLMYFLEDDESS